MSRLNWPHAEQQEDCSSIWGQQLRRRGHQTETSSVLQEDRIYPSIEVVDPKRTNASPYNSRADLQAKIIRVRSPNGFVHLTFTWPVASENAEIHFFSVYTNISKKAKDPNLCVFPLIYLYFTASLAYSAD